MLTVILSSYYTRLCQEVAGRTDGPKVTKIFILQAAGKGIDETAQGPVAQN